MIIIPEDLELKKPKKELEEIINNTIIDEKVLFQKKSDFHDITVVKNDFGTFLKFADTYQAGYVKSKNYTGNLPYINYFLIPYLMKKDIEKILFIGFGSGIIVNQYEKLFKNLKAIDIVDIEENIFPIAQKYFDFKISENMNFYLQDAIVFLKSTKTKYDLIITDVAGDVGIDDRFISQEYFDLINKRLKKNGIFVSNLPSSRDIFNNNNIFLGILDDYKKNFAQIKLFNGETSNKIFYKTFFNIDEVVFDITNVIIISSNKEYKISKPNKAIIEICPSVDEYLKDIISI